MALREGWTTFLLIALVVFTATWSVQLADWADGLEILSLITLAGLVVGLVLANLRRVPAILAHLLALVVGAVVVLYQMTGFLSDALGGRRAKLEYLWTRWELWYAAVSRGERADDLYLFILLMAALLWILSYISVWFVFRSHWVWLALVLPGVILLLNMGYSQRVPHGLVVLYLFAAILLLVRFTVAQRELMWKRLAVPYPDTLPWRGLWVGSCLALVVILTGWMLPLSTQSERIQAAWQEMNGPWRRVEATFNNWFASLRGPGGRGVGGFTSFSNQFELGGPLRLSDEPVLLLKGNQAPYLVAHRYDTFDGRTWRSEPLSRWRDDLSAVERLYSPLLEFEADQPYPLPTDTTTARTERQYTIEIQQPPGGVVFSTGDAARVSIPTRLQVGWRLFHNETVDVQAATEASTAPWLWPLVRLLQQADYTPPEPTPEPSPSAMEGASPEGAATPVVAAPTPPSFGVPAQQPEIMEEVGRLRERGIEVSFEPDPTDFRVHALTFSGPLPVFRDVDAIFAQHGVRAGDTYQVTALVSEATPDQLRAAGTDYPAEVVDRYLQLPHYSTRTRQLAQELAAGQRTPFDIAAAIEQYLRTHIAYNENVPNPPAGRDLVDYFLFDLRQGYCTYYASAMVEMLRILGIPSRVVVGFYPAEYDANLGGYLYRQRHAHAWVEVYFPQYGWIPFEPTAARPAIQRGAPPTPAASGGGTGVLGGDNLPSDREAQLLAELNDVGFSGSTTTVTRQETSRGQWLLRGVVVAVVLGIAVVSSFWLRGTRGMTPATQLFSKAQRGARWSGLPPRAAQTPYEYAAVVARHLPAARPHIRLLADLYVRERYGRRPASPEELNRARTAWLRLRTLLLRYGLLQRWRRRGADGDEAR
ncbi:MAG: transglutaminase domain-containing protein [Sphaerobacter sp.]|nr:transglutaminase domain-containing protein [Sphaerobacter sp.]